MKEKLSLLRWRSRNRTMIMFWMHFVLCVALLGQQNGYAQSDTEVTISGKVTDGVGAPLPGATIVVVGTTRDVITDVDGIYSIMVKPTDKLTFSFVGMKSQVVDIGNKRIIDVTLFEQSDELEEVTIVAFGKQKKESVISSIETVKADELRVPSSNLTTAFAGRMAGMISYQTSGEPGEDNAEFFIRGVTSFGTGKVDPLILVDNIEMSADDLARLHPDDIAAFSILKDATGTALYGARAANGVILVTTGAEEFTGFMDNTDIPKKIRKLLIEK